MIAHRRRLFFWHLMGMRRTRLLAAIAALAAPAAALTVGPTLRPAAGAAQRTSGRVRAVAELVRADSPPAIGTALPDCPPTIWDADEIDIEAWQKQYREEGLPTCPIEIHATEAANAAGAAWFVERREELKATLEKHGTIWFRGFELMKDADGFRSFWESLDLDPCLDPLHTSGLRKLLSPRSGIIRIPVQPALERAAYSTVFGRIPLYPSYSHGALNALHGTAFPA